MKSNTVIINYGMGNLHSVKRKLGRLNFKAVISSDPAEILEADKIILPGVGHFKKAMENLKTLRLLEVLNEAVLVKETPILGICLGMQLMAASSEEGHTKGLGWFDAEVLRFNVQNPLLYKVPHMGWNQVQIKKESRLMKAIPEFAEFYFVHSYYVKTHNIKDDLNTTEYEGIFTSAIEKNNIFGVQYHPEKSHDVGETLLKNFISI